MLLHSTREISLSYSSILIALFVFLSVMVVDPDLHEFEVKPTRRKSIQSLVENVGGAELLDRRALLQRKREQRIARRLSLFKQADDRYVRSTLEPHIHPRSTFTRFLQAVALPAHTGYLFALVEDAFTYHMSTRRHTPY